MYELHFFISELGLKRIEAAITIQAFLWMS